MTADDWQRIKVFFGDALQRKGADRAAFIQEICERDEAIGCEVKRLLTENEQAGSFLEQPCLQLESRLTETAGETGDGAEPSSGRIVGPYQIVRMISHGGMGTVYLAERTDGQYRKRVAIKLVHPHLEAVNILRRFRNERQVLAALDHPNIVRLLDGGVNEDGLPYLVMDYVEGMRIDSWCDSRTLSLRDRLKLFGKVCDSVQYAHERQVIHRDIKPGNVLVAADGTPKLLDFGIAKVLNPDLYSETIDTTAGVGPMTPEYASPEQVRGQPVGPASDVYSLGVLLYKLITGRLPYSLQGLDMPRLAQVICEKEPVKPSVAVLEGEADMQHISAKEEALSAGSGDSRAGLRRALTGDLDNIVLMALRKQPERRYLSVQEFSADIDRVLEDLPVHARKEGLPYYCRKFVARNRVLIKVATISAVMAVALVTGLQWFSSGVVPADVSSIAVLPLANLSGDQEQEHFADGITDALISELARIPALRVISRTSIMSYKGKERRLPEIAHSLGVRTIAEGSVLRTGHRVRIALRLVDAPKDRAIWSGSYEGDLQNVLALQSRVAEAIAGEIHVTMTEPIKQRVVRDRRVDIDAYDAYLKGRRQYVTDFNSVDGMKRAIDWFQRALTLDPNYAPAYAGLADCYYMASGRIYPPHEAMPKARSAALRAIQLDETLGEAHATLALVRSLYEYDRREAEKEFKKAIELKPGDAQSHVWYGSYLAAMGRFDEAVAEAERAQKLDPVSPGLNGYIGAILYFAHRYDQIIQRMQPIIEMYPDLTEPRWWRAMAYEQKGDWDKAIADAESCCKKLVDPMVDNTDGFAQLGHIYAVSGRSADARTVLRQLTELSAKREVPAYTVAILCAGLDERDEAFRWLQIARENREEDIAFVNVDPRLGSLHSDPRFAALLQDVGLGK